MMVTRWRLWWVIVLVASSAGSLWGADSTRRSSIKKARIQKNNFLIPRHEIKRGASKDGIPALLNPFTKSAAKSSWLRDADLVVGVVVGKVARAYPIRILNWHELVNDTLATVPILISYCPLCHSVVVADRTVAGKVLSFGVSGLLWNSNVLMYDHQTGSLWSQLQMRAVSGSGAKQQHTLAVRAAEMVSWKDWRTRHPQTTVLAKRTGYARDYNRNVYAERGYFTNQRIWFPVQAKAALRKKFNDKERMLLVKTKQTWTAYPTTAIAAIINRDGGFTALQDGVEIRLVYDTVGKVLRAELGQNTPAAPRSLKTAYSFWFAWAATNPDTEIYQPPKVVAQSDAK